MHCGHKLLELNDEESLKKEKISLIDSKKEFEKIISKTVELKEKIEQQINEINNLYEKVNKEVTNNFQMKHEQLIKKLPFSSVQNKFKGTEGCSGHLISIGT